MLQGMRKAGQGWIGKTFIGVLFALLILSFAIWGIEDVFRGYGRNTVATVGSTEITTEQVRTAYQNEIQRLTRQFRQPITPERARALGIDAQVLGRLVTEATLDADARKLGLGITDAEIVKSIENDPSFRGASGKFDRAVFADLLRNNGLTEAAFVSDQRAHLVRRQIPEGLTGGLTVPAAVRAEIFRLGAERRSVEYFTLPAASAGEIGTPDDAALTSFFNDRKSSFRAPEYRKLTVLSLTPDAVAKPSDVTDADAQAHYETVKTSRFGSPERRHVQQLGFASIEEANGVSERIKAGTGFDDIARERGVAEKDLDLGTVAKAEIFDPAVGDAAFALPAGGVSAPVAGKFGPVIVRVVTVEPERIKPFAEVADEVKAEIARERARGAIADLHDKIEDERAAAKALGEIAKDLGLAVRTVEATDRNGLDKAGQAVPDLPDRDPLLAAAFASDIGADNEALRTGNNGYLWFEIAAIDPARDRSLDEVRDEVVKLWRSDEIARRLTEKARELAGQIDGGTAVSAVASAQGQTAKTADGLQRNAAKDGLPVPAVTQIFATHAGKAGSVAVDDGNARIVFKVTSATVPAFDPKAEDARIDEQLRLALSDDLLTAYVRKLETDFGVAVNQQALRSAFGTSGEY